MWWGQTRHTFLGVKNQSNCSNEDGLLFYRTASCVSGSFTTTQSITCTSYLEFLPRCSKSSNKLSTFAPKSSIVIKRIHMGDSWINYLNLMNNKNPNNKWCRTYKVCVIYSIVAPVGGLLIRVWWSFLPPGLKLKLIKAEDDIKEINYRDKPHIQIVSANLQLLLCHRGDKNNWQWRKY